MFFLSFVVALMVGLHVSSLLFCFVLFSLIKIPFVHLCGIQKN